MRLFRAAAAAVLTSSFAIAACGGAPPPATTAPALASAAPPEPNGASVASAPAPRVLAPLETAAPDARGVLHVDGKKLRDTPLFAAVMQSLSLFGGTRALDDIASACGFSPVDAVDEIVVSDTGTPLIALKVNVPPEKVLACAKRLGNGDTTFQGRPAVSVQRLTAIAEGDMVLLGAESNLEAALARKGQGPSDLAKATVLAGGEVAAFRGSVGDSHIDGVEARMMATPQEFGVQLRIACNDDKTAQMVLGQKDMLAGIFGHKASPQAKELLESIHARAEGNTVLVDFGVKGDATAQAQYVGNLAAVGIAGFRDYIARSKSAEARNAVGQIAKSLVAYAEAHKKFPPSAPPVPKEAPRGMKYQSSPNDWSGSWNAIHFEMDVPQYYSYAFKTAPNGKSVTITAHGDLNADGKLSTFEMKLDYAKDKTTMGELKETDATE